VIVYVDVHKYMVFGILKKTNELKVKVKTEVNHCV
jgi:hypothetical protein